MEVMNLQRIIDNAKETGTMQLQDANITVFPEELYYAETAASAVKFYEANAITKLIVKNVPLTAIDEDKMKELYALESVSIINGELSKFRFASDKLAVLDVSGNRIEELPLLSTYPVLKVLRANKNLLRTIRIESNTLVELSLAECELTECVFNCPVLLLLNLESNKLRELNFQHLTSLTELDVSKNKLTQLDLAPCSKLFMLNASYNCIASGIAECEALAWIEGAFSLKEANFSFNELEATPPSIFSCAELLKISFANNNIEAVLIQAQCSWDKSRLQFLDFSCNGLQEVPAELSLISSLEKLILYGNPLRKMSKLTEETNISQIRWFLQQKLPLNHDYYRKQAFEAEDREERVLRARLNDVAASQLRLEFHGQKVPNQVFSSNVSAIKELVIDSPKMFNEDLADMLASRLHQFLNLQQLSLNAVEFSNFAVIGVPALQELSITNSRKFEAFQATACPELLQIEVRKTGLVEIVISDCAKLVCLDLSENQLDLIGEYILDNTQLEEINLSNNHISCLPPRIFELRDLVHLNLDGNRVQYLPPELGLLAPVHQHTSNQTRPFAGKLTRLSIEGNYVLQPKNAVCKRGTSAILDKLRDMLDVAALTAKYARQ